VRTIDVRPVRGLPSDRSETGARAGDEAQRTWKYTSLRAAEQQRIKSIWQAKSMGGEPFPRHLQLIAVAASFRT
jgi:hypothetical protein